MLNLTERNAHIAPGANLRTQKHGEEDVPAVDVTISGIGLDADELDKLFGHPQTAESFYDVEGDEVPRLKFPGLEPVRFTEKIEGLRVTLKIGKTVVQLSPSTGRKITVEFTDLGARMSLQVQCAEPAKDAVPKLFAALNQGCRVTIEPIQSDLVDEAAADAAAAADSDEAEDPEAAAA